MRRKQEWRFPVEAITDSTRRARANKTSFAGFQVDASHAAVLTLKINLIGIFGVDQSDKAVAAADAIPIGVNGAGSVFASRWSAPTAVVLQAAVNVVVHRGVDASVIKLTDRDMVQMVPVLHAVVSDVNAAVVA